MELRYMGFDQRRNERVYRFDAIEKGQAIQRYVISADMALFLAHRIGIQEGPTLAAVKLAAGLVNKTAGEHELTADDLRSHASARLAADAKRAETRRPPRRRPAGADENSPWRNAGNTGV